MYACLAVAVGGAELEPHEEAEQHAGEHCEGLFHGEPAHVVQERVFEEPLDGTLAYEVLQDVTLEHAVPLGVTLV